MNPTNTHKPTNLQSPKGPENKPDTETQETPGSKTDKAQSKASKPERMPGMPQSLPSPVGPHWPLVTRRPRD
jgi:hypothetical protein